MTAYLLNLADLFLTLHALSHGGVELNPLLQNPAVMVAWKVVGVGVLCWVLTKIATSPQQDSNKLARQGLNLCTVVYTVLLFYHFYFFGGMYL